MKNYIRWIILALLITILTLIAVQGVSQYSNKDTVRGVSNDVYAQLISDTLSPTNDNFSRNNFTVSSISYITNTVALAKTSVKDGKLGLAVYVVFELKDNQLHITNYGTSLSTVDFREDSVTTESIISTVNKT